ncbi:hypothetical protein RIF29_17929 [Crotalaria pallida]|uniref:Uncharacterized protein n=1 Tax=Crotalaria pallida TaxID=3830 RepID=A0AAN9FRS0_CROPI
MLLDLLLWVSRISSYGSESEGDEEAGTMTLSSDIGRVNRASTKSSLVNMFNERPDNFHIHCKPDGKGKSGDEMQDNQDEEEDGEDAEDSENDEDLD